MKLSIGGAGPGEGPSQRGRHICVELQLRSGDALLFGCAGRLISYGIKELPEKGIWPKGLSLCRKTKHHAACKLSGRGEWHE